MSAPDAGGRLIRGSAARVLGTLAGNLCAAGAAVLLLRDLGVEDFGRYSTVIALVAIVQGVSDVGLSVTAMRELALLPEAGRRALLEQIVGARLLLSSVGIALAVAFSWLAGYSGTQVLGTLVAGVGIVLSSTQAALVLPLSVELRNGAVAVNDLLRQAAVAGSLAVLVLLSAPLGWFFVAQVVAGIVGLAAVPLLVGRAGVVRPRVDPARLRALLRVAAPVGVASVLSIVYFRILVVLVSLLTDARETGLYVTAARVFELAIGLPLLLSVVAIPLLSVAARDDPARLGGLVRRTTEAMAVAGVAVAIGLATGARPILLLLGGEQYSGAAPVLRILALALVTLFVGAAWTPALLALGRARAVAGASAAGLGALVVLGIGFTTAFGVRGAAAAVVVADLVTVGGTLLALRRAGPGRALELGFGVRIAAAALPAVALGFAPGVPDALGAVGAVALFGGLALLLRLVPGEVLVAMLGRPPRRPR